MTQVLQGVGAGESDHDANYVGSAGAWLGIDTGRTGLWPAGLVFAHFQGIWGDATDGTGALLPLDADAIMPDTPPDSAALSKLYLSQALSENTQVFVGKADWASFVDTTFFANNERTQFLNEGLVNDPLLGSFVPYTSLGAVAVVETTERSGLAAGVVQNASKATNAGFEDLEIEKLTIVFAANYSANFFHLPGRYQLLAGYTTRDTVDFAIDRRYLIEEILGLAPVNEEPVTTVSRDRVGDLNREAVEVGDFPGSFEIPGPRGISLAIGGFVKVEALYDSDAENRGADFLPATLGVSRSNDDGDFSVDATLTRLHLDGRVSTDWGDIRGYVEWDLNENNDGEVGVKWRHPMEPGPRRRARFW